MNQYSSTARVLVLTKEGSNFHKLLTPVLVKFKSVSFESEHSFVKVIQLIEYINKNNIDLVLLPNPYGNNKRRVSYKKLKEHNIDVAVFDRGGLPDSWFFDSGFNAESSSYDVSNWDYPLDQSQIASIETYIKWLHGGERALENQGLRQGSDSLREDLGFDRNTKIIFVPLQRPTDTVIRCFSGSVSSVDQFISWVDETANQINRKQDKKYVFLLKKHPLENNYFQTESEYVGYVDQDTNMYDLLELSDAVLLINSGVGLNALTYGKKVITVGESYYCKPGLARRAESIDEIVELLTQKWAVDNEKVLSFFYYLVNSFYTFGASSYKEIKNKEDSGKTRLVTRIDFSKVHFPKFSLDISAKEILYISPLVPYPLYRGNQARIDSFIMTLSEKYVVDLIVMNTSFPFESNKTLQKQLEERYPLVRSIKVFLDPNLEDKVFKRNLSRFKSNLPIVGKKNLSEISRGYLIKNKPILKNLTKQGVMVSNHKVRSSIQSMNGKDPLINEKTCPNKLKNIVNDRCLSVKYDFIFTNYAKTMGAIPDEFEGKVILDTHDYQTQFILEDQEVNKKNTNIDIHEFRKSEVEAIKKADTIIAINPNEAAIFESLLNEEQHKNDIVTIPAFFANREKPKIKFWGKSIDILYVGSVSNFNVSGLNWFLEEVLPKLVKISSKSIKVHVAGNISRSKDIDWDRHEEYLNVLGKVDNLDALYESTKCCIAPILGGAGMKIKVVEALSYGKCIVATHKAVEGINWKPYQAIKVTDNPKEYAVEIHKIISQSQYRNNLEREASLLFEKEHSLNSIKSRLYSIIN